MDCVFCKIRDKIIPKEFIYEDDEIMVFPDIHPIKPVHLLIVPKKHIPEIISVEDSKIFGKLFEAVKKMVKEKELENKGYRIVINGGGAQLINHLHLHLVGPISKDAKM